MPTLALAYRSVDVAERPNFANSSARWLWEVEETGFHAQEWWGDEAVRWTDGHGTLRIPLSDQAVPIPKKVRIVLASIGPASKQVEILVNDAPIFSEVLSSGRWIGEFDLSRFDFDREVKIELISGTFIPSETDRDSTDGRRLGVAVAAIGLGR